MTWFRLAYLMYLLPLPFLTGQIHAGTVAYLMGLGVVTVVFLAGLIRDAVPDAPGRRTRPADAPEEAWSGEGTSEPSEPLTEAPVSDDEEQDDDVSALVEAIADRVIAAIEESIETEAPVRMVIGRAVYMIDVRARSRGLSDPALRN
jgi:hypothetical protein